MTDRRRIQGPEITVAPIIIKSPDKEKIQFRDVNGQRRDGRNLEDIRPICIYFESHRDRDLIRNVALNFMVFFLQI